MARAPAKKAAPAAPTRAFALEDHLIFKGYGDPQPEEPKLLEGEVVKVIGFKEDDDEGYYVESVITGEQDTAFNPDEVEEYASQEEVDGAYAEKEGEGEGEPEAEAEAEPEVEAEPEAEPAPVTRGRGKAAAPAKPAAKAAPAKAPATKAAAPAAAKAPAKATAAKAPAAKAAAPAGKAAAKAQLAAKAEAKPEAEEIEIIDTELLREALDSAGDALSAADALVQQAETSHYTLGGVLLHIERDGLYKERGYDGKDGFNNYVETELGIKYRMSRQLMQMYAHFTALGISEERLGTIGWTKARELLVVKDTKHVEAAIEYAQGHTRDELIQHVQSKYVKADKSAGRKGKTDAPASARVKKTIFKFSALEAEADLISNAVARSKEIIGSESDDEAIRHIFTEWAQTHGGLDVELEPALQALEARFGINLAIVDENGNVIEGEEEQTEAA